MASGVEKDFSIGAVTSRLGAVFLFEHFARKSLCAYFHLALLLRLGG